jgi:hypothetical protein
MGNSPKLLTVQAKVSSCSCSEPWNFAYPNSCIIIMQSTVAYVFQYAWTLNECILTCILGAVEHAVSVMAVESCVGSFIE